MRPAKAIIDLKALRQNYQLAGSITGAKAIAVVKADAYGHGAVQCAKALEDIAPAFAVACLEEALQLRESGINTPILLLEGFFEDHELTLIDQFNLWPVIHSHWQIKALEKTQLTKKLQIFLKLDSGMHRVGFFPKDYASAYQQLMSTQKVANIILMTHFARADELDCEYTKTQWEVFKNASKGLIAETCVCNSPALLAWPGLIGDWSRPGIMLYGSTPFNQPQSLAEQLKPVMTLQSKIISTRELPIGEPIGYGGSFITQNPTRIGVVAIGYADGYPRQAPNDTPVMINGKRSRIIGRVSMDMLTVDLTNHPEADLGTDVELWGNHVTASEVAAHCNTISYQLFCNIKRVVRLYNN